MPKKISQSLKRQFAKPEKLLLQHFKQEDLAFEEIIEDYEYILHCIDNDLIKIKKPNTNHTEYKESTASDNGNDLNSTSGKEKRSRLRKANNIQREERDKSSESDKLDSSISSTSSSRSRRAAAQAADQKLAQVQNFMKATKLRRPTNFDEKKNKRATSVPSPPTKSRRTHRVQSAGSSSSSVVEIENDMCVDNCVNMDCVVSVSKLSTPEIKSHTKSESNNKPLGRISTHRMSPDVFEVEDEVPLSTLSKYEPEDGLQLEKVHLPVKCETGEVFKGFEENKYTKQVVTKKRTVQRLTHKIELENISSEQMIRNGAIRKSKSNTEEVEEKKVKTSNKRTYLDVLSVSSEETEEDQEEKKPSQVHNGERKSLNSRSHTIMIETVSSKQNNEQNTHDSSASESEKESPEVNIRTRTRTIKKNIDNVNYGEETNLMSETVTVKQTTDADNVVYKEMENPNSPDGEIQIRSRTKTIKKAMNPQENLDTRLENMNLELKEPAEVTNKHRKQSNKASTSENTDSSDSEKQIKSRTKTIKKAVSSQENLDINSKHLASELNEQDTRTNIQKAITSVTTVTPTEVKGKLVKKRVEDFEQMRNKGEETEEILTGRVTRNATRNKALLRKAQTVKQTRETAARAKKNMKVSIKKLTRDKTKEEKENIPAFQPGSSSKSQQVERSCLTPLSANRPFPAFTIVEKGLRSANQNIVDKNYTEIQKQVPEDADKKKKEEEILKRQAKEEEAKKKKEYTLKVTAEETRRKREEKLQKVVAAREAAEKEKALLAVKADKEKQKKLLQMAAEKEKMKEEKQKKKMLMQQKVMENEERRRQEEAARMARLKEQEEEHKRILAMKEKEQETLKRMKAAELKALEAEKTKPHCKPAKVAAIDSSKTQCQVTPAVVTSVQSYELTPAREDRPLLKPKTQNDYGIDDANTDDSSDDESRPKKIIPSWAKEGARDHLLRVNSYIPMKLWRLFMTCDKKPDINKLFAGAPIKKRIRTSSAVWNTPDSSFNSH